MAQSYQYFPIDPYNVSATYYGDGLEFPFPYKIKLIEKENPIPFWDIFDFQITEVSTEITRTISMDKLMQAKSQHEGNLDLGVLLFGNPNAFIPQSDFGKCDTIILHNKEYFKRKMTEYGVGAEKIYTLLALEIIVHFTELLTMIQNDLAEQSREAN